METTTTYITHVMCVIGKGSNILTKSPKITRLFHKRQSSISSQGKVSPSSYGVGRMGGASPSYSIYVYSMVKSSFDGCIVIQICTCACMLSACSDVVMFGI